MVLEKEFSSPLAQVLDFFLSKNSAHRFECEVGCYFFSRCEDLKKHFRSFSLIVALFISPWSGGIFKS